MGAHHGPCATTHSQRPLQPNLPGRPSRTIRTQPAVPRYAAEAGLCGSRYFYLGQTKKRYMTIEKPEDAALQRYRSEEAS
jgi:hypothetical protein